LDAMKPQHSFEHYSWEILNMIYRTLKFSNMFVYLINSKGIRNMVLYPFIYLQKNELDTN